MGEHVVLYSWLPGQELRHARLGQSDANRHDHGLVRRSGPEFRLTQPAGWLCIEHNSVLVTGAWPESLSVGDFSVLCAKPLHLHAQNLTSHPTSPFELRLRVGPLGEAFRCTVGPLDSEQRRAITALPDPSLRHALETVFTPHPVNLKAFIADRLVTSFPQKMVVLPADSWTQRRGNLSALVAHVCPDDPIVNALATDCPVRPGAVEDVLEAVYLRLQQEQIRYRDPRVEEIGDVQFQRIQTAAGLRESRRACCLDLAVLTAAILENLGRWPVLLLAGPKPFQADHALLACWNGEAPGLRCVLSNEQLVHDAEKGYLRMIESTAVASGFAGNPMSMDPTEALEAAWQAIKRPWVCGVDVGAIRPPRGAVLPLQQAMSPLVRACFRRAHELAQRHRRAGVELTFLFAALLLEGSDLTREILHLLGWAPSRLADAILSHVRAGSASAPPRETGTVARCRASLDGLRRQHRKGCADEQTLWEAVVLTAPHGQLVHYLRAVGVQGGWLKLASDHLRSLSQNHLSEETSRIP
jgi:hypothetical protein